jgi:hypothetical protein
MDEFNVKFKAKGAKSWSTCLSNTINTFLDILTNNLAKQLPPSHNVDHKN